MRRLKKAGLTLLIVSMLFSSSALTAFAKPGPGSASPDPEQTAELTQVVSAGPGPVIVHTPESVVIPAATPEQTPQAHSNRKQ